MSMVIDSSVTLAWFFDDEKEASTNRLLSMVVAEGARVPGIWRLEVANGFHQGVKRKRVGVVKRGQALA
jgi:hypothetical protein